MYSRPLSSSTLIEKGFTIPAEAWAIVKPGLFAYRAVPTMILCETKSHGTKSRTVSESIGNESMTPRPAATIMAPPAENVSVHPGTGSLNEDPTIAGLTIHIGKFAGLFFLSILSAIDFVNVYVFGKSPNIFERFSSCYSFVIYSIFFIISS